MTDSGLENLGYLIFVGLLFHGCTSGLGGRVNINEHEIVDEARIAEGIVEAACYMDGRNWEYGKCK